MQVLWDRIRTNQKMKGKAKICGEMMEERFMKMFRGKKRHLEEIDFETSTSLYEVKSCSLFNRCYNANHLKPFIIKRHKRCETRQLGRFQIITNNHIMLYLRALEAGKIPKYIFALRFGKQAIFRVIKWEEVIVPNTKDYHYILLKDIFDEDSIITTD